jgi:hypothetical protein
VPTQSSTFHPAPRWLGLYSRQADTVSSTIIKTVETKEHNNVQRHLAATRYTRPRLSRMVVELLKMELYANVLGLQEMSTSGKARRTEQEEF